MRLRDCGAVFGAQLRCERRRVGRKTITIADKVRNLRMVTKVCAGFWKYALSVCSFALLADHKHWHTRALKLTVLKRIHHQSISTPAARSVLRILEKRALENQTPYLHIAQNVLERAL